MRAAFGHGSSGRSRAPRVVRTRGTAAGGNGESAGDEPGFHIACFDDRRGMKEGREREAILLYYPRTTVEHVRLSQVGIARGLLVLASEFEGEFPMECMETDAALWVVMRVEPHIWLLIVAERKWCGYHVRVSTLQALLREVHALLRLLHGPIEWLLLADASGDSVRQLLAPDLEHIAAQIAAPEGPLSAKGGLGRAAAPLPAGIPLCPQSRGTWLYVQCLLGGLMATGPGRLTGVVALAGRSLSSNATVHALWSSLGVEDSAALCGLAAAVLVPAMRRKGKKSRGRAIKHVLSGSGRAGRSSEADPGGHPLCPDSWQVDPHGWLVCTSEGGYLPYGAPRIHLQQGEEQCHLMVYTVDALMLLLLVSDPPSHIVQLRSDLAEALRRPAAEIAASTNKMLNGVSDFHVRGLRYVYNNKDTQLVRASPEVKTAAYTRDGLRLMSDVRASLEEASRQYDLAASQAARDDPNAPPPSTYDAAVHVRAGAWSLDTWAGGLASGPAALIYASEGAEDDTLKGAVHRVRHLAARHFAGQFGLP